MQIYVVNKSSLVSNTNVKKMVSAIEQQFYHDYRQAWGKSVHIAFLSVDDNRQNTIYIFDDPDTAGALGYHDETPDGRIYGKVFARVDGQPQDLFGPNGMSPTLSHEGLEMAGDPTINFWVDEPDGKTQTAFELSDACEGDSYPKTLSDGTVVYVSNFLFPAWFDDHAPDGTQCDWLDTTPGPFQFSTASVGSNYKIVRNIGTGEKQIFGSIHPSKRAGKLFVGSRTARRLKGADTSVSTG